MKLTCLPSRELYDECSSQKEILKQATAKAKETGKTVLVVYGAEWCIWCHVFDKYVKGHSRKFKYKWQWHDGENQKWKMKERENKNAVAEAKKLNRFVPENFIVVHIESHHSADGSQTFYDTGLHPDDFSYLPVIYVLNSSGLCASNMLAYDAIPGMEIRQDSGREFRGFDRNLLHAELVKLLADASMAVSGEAK